jgi:hypothetical protein
MRAAAASKRGASQGCLGLRPLQLAHSGHVCCICQPPAASQCAACPPLPCQPWSPRRHQPAHCSVGIARLPLLPRRHIYLSVRPLFRGFEPDAVRLPTGWGALSFIHWLLSVLFFFRVRLSLLRRWPEVGEVVGAAAARLVLSLQINSAGQKFYTHRRPYLTLRLPSKSSAGTSLIRSCENYRRSTLPEPRDAILDFCDVAPACQPASMVCFGWATPRGTRTA